MKNGIAAAALAGFARWAAGIIGALVFAHYGPLLASYNVSATDFVAALAGLIATLGALVWSYLDKIGVAQKIASVAAFVEANPALAKIVAEAAQKGTLEVVAPAALQAKK